MDLIFAKSKWEWWAKPTDLFLKKAKEDGFSATEFYLNETHESLQELVALHEKYDLKIIAQILTEGSNINEHMDSLEKLAGKAIECNAVLVNCHPGKDFFSFEENLILLKRLSSLTKERNIPFSAETHRGRATFSLPQTVRFLNEVPDLMLTTDISHWMVVHESDLSNQSENLDYVIERSCHIHARVGYEEGPQVPDPRAPEWHKHLENHLAVWQKIVNSCKSRGMEYLTVTPEFGPPNYMHTLPYSNNPVSDAWELNVAMKKILKDRLIL